MSGEPWLAREGWAERRIKDDWVDGIFVLIFPGIDLLLVGVGVYLMMHRRRFGIPVFELATLPAVPGEALAGLVRTTGTIDPEGGFKLRLQCLRLIETGSGKNRYSGLLLPPRWQRRDVRECTSRPGCRAARLSQLLPYGRDAVVAGSPSPPGLLLR